MSLDALPAISARDVPIATAAQMAEADRAASTDLGIPLEVLMENAAHQIALATRLFLGSVSGKHVVAVCGTGNNGGDALAALRHLRGWGGRVEAYVAGARDALRPLARLQCEVLERIGVAIRNTTELTDLALVDQTKGVDVVVDGLLGYSARGAPRGEIARLITLLHAARGGGLRPIVAVDLPSGLDPDTGGTPAPIPAGAITAALTVTLALPKAGLLAEGARRWVGELVLADIGIPAEAYARTGIDARRVFAEGDLLRIIH
jgi:NAD(P)H-hydrate epimerase